MKKLLLVLVMVMVGTAAAAPPCWACSCRPMTKKEHAKAADVIFTGKVVKIEEIQDGSALKVRFRVGKVYKGHPKRLTNVYTASEGSLCGAGFEVDKKYTVFAQWSGDSGRKWTNHCAGNKQGPINPDNYGLGEGYPPED